MKTLAILGLALMTVTAAAYPPDNAAVLYYRACLTKQTPDDAVKADIDSYITGDAEPTEALRNFVAGQRLTLKAVADAAAVEHCDWGHDYSLGFEMILPGLADLRQMGKVVLADALLAADAGDAEKAVDRVCSVLGMAQHLRQGPLISVLVAMSLEKSTVDAVGGMLASISDERLLSRLEDTLAASASGVQPAFIEAMRLETLALHNTPPELMEPMIAPSEDFPGPLDAATAAAGLDYYDAKMGVLIESFRKPYQQGRPEIMDLHQEIRTEALRDRKAILSAAVIPAFRNAVGHLARNKTLLGAMQTAVAVRRVQVRTGTLPAELPEHMPRDAFSGQPFEYQLTTKGFVLRCRGKDLDKDVVHEYEFHVIE